MKRDPAPNRRGRAIPRVYAKPVAHGTDAKRQRNAQAREPRRQKRASGVSPRWSATHDPNVDAALPPPAYAGGSDFDAIKLRRDHVLQRRHRRLTPAAHELMQNGIVMHNARARASGAKTSLGRQPEVERRTTYGIENV